MKHPLPPFTLETPRQKVQAAEDAWNTCDPDRMAPACTEDTEWRNRSEFVHGRETVHTFLRCKWERELDCKLKKELRTFAGNRIAVRLEYEWHDASGQWLRPCGYENREFAADGLMPRGFASINDMAIAGEARRFFSAPPFRGLTHFPNSTT